MSGTAMIDFAKYKDAFETIKLERSPSGILQMTLHSNGGPYVWDARAGTGVSHQELGDALQHIARDRENKVVILTRSGDRFSGPQDSAHFPNRMVPGDGIALIFPFLMLRHTRSVLTAPLKALLRQYLELDLALEALAAIDEGSH